MRSSTLRQQPALEELAVPNPFAPFGAMSVKNPDLLCFVVSLSQKKAIKLLARTINY